MKSILEKTPSELVELYIKENIKLKILINWMCKIFSYMNGSGEHSLFTKSHKIYVQEFIPIKVRDQIFNAVNTLIERDRDSYQVDRSLIKQCLYVYEDLDIVNPTIVIEKSGSGENSVNIFKWEGEKSLKKYDIWFESFEKHTKAYVKRKSTEEISKFNALEYINSSIKYLESEIERKDYFNKKYHERIDSINHKFVIEDNIDAMIKVKFLFINLW